MVLMQKGYPDVYGVIGVLHAIKRDRTLERMVEAGTIHVPAPPNLIFEFDNFGDIEEKAIAYLHYITQPDRHIIDLFLDNVIFKDLQTFSDKAIEAYNTPLLRVQIIADKLRSRFEHGSPFPILFGMGFIVCARCSHRFYCAEGWWLSFLNKRQRSGAKLLAKCTIAVLSFVGRRPGLQRFISGFADSFIRPNKESVWESLEELRGKCDAFDAALKAEEIGQKLPDSGAPSIRREIR